MPHQISRPVVWGLPTARARYVYRPPIAHLPVESCPPHGPRSFTIDADVTIDGTSEGILVNRGTSNGGYALYIKGGQLRFVYNMFHHRTAAIAEAPLPAGRCSVGVRVTAHEDPPGQAPGSAGGVAILVLNGREFGGAAVAIPAFSRTLSSIGMDLGRCIAPVTPDYARPFAFTGTIHAVTFDVPGYTGSSAAEVTAAARERLGLM